MKPILFNTEMVQAITEGRKTVTRRVVKLDLGLADTDKNDSSYLKVPDKDGDYHDAKDLCRYQEGDILWVRETWYYENHMHDLTAGEPDLPNGEYSHRYVYKASKSDYPVNVGVGKHGWKPSIHMPREAARIFLKVTDVRVERLQDITETQVRKEGFRDYLAANDTFYPCGYYFRQTWDSTINKKDFDKYGWEGNPWVFVISFIKISKEEVLKTDA